MISVLHFFLFVLLLLPVGGCRLARGQAPDAYVGRVIDTRGHTLTGAVVYSAEQNWGGVTNDRGIFRIQPPLQFPVTLYIRHLGYEVQVIHITKSHSPNDTIDVVLKPVSLILGEVLIEGTEPSEPWHTGQTSERMDGEELRRNGSFTLMQGLERLPGIAQMQTGIGLAKPVIRGLSFNRVAVTDGNIRQEGQQWGVDHGLEVDPFQIDEVRIVKGPAGLFYGSDAMAGVIQLIPVPIMTQDKLEGSVSAIGRSVNNHFGAHVSLQGALGHAWGWSIRATTHTYSDYRLPADSFSYNRFRIPLPGRRLDNTAGREAHWALDLRRSLPRGSTQLTYKRFGQELGFFPGAIGRPLGYKLNPGSSKNDVGSPQQIIVHHRMGWHTQLQGDRGDWEIDLGGQYNDRRELSNPHAHGRRYLDSTQQLSHGMWLGTASWNLRYQPHQHGASRWMLGSSGQLQQNRIGGYEFLIPAYKASQAGLFVVRNTGTATGWEVLTGLRVDVSRQRSDAYTDRYLSDSGFVQRIRAPALLRGYLSATGSCGLNWTDGKGSAFNLHMGNSFRLPGLPELASNGVHHGSFRHEQGDSSLRPEQGWQFDVGGEHQTGRWKLKGSIYFNYFSRYIYLRPTGYFSFLPEGGQIFRYTQGRVLHTGGEVQVDYRLDLANTITATGEYVWIQNTSTGVPLPWSPPSSLWLSWKHNIKRTKARVADNPYPSTENKNGGGASLSGDSAYTPTTRMPASAFLNFDWILVAAQNRTDRNEEPTSGYNLLQLQAGWQQPLKGRHMLVVRLQAHNLLNRRYFNHLSRYRLIQLPEPGRNVQLILTLHF